jgi:uncharacterized surface protein with fasciclin (FAS1) repeats
MFGRKTLIVLMALAVLASVAMPAFAQGIAQQKAPAQASKDPVISALQSKPDLSQFMKALRESDMDSVLNSGEKYTVFAPVNDAFSRMPSDKASIMDQNKQGRDYVLEYHVVEGILTPQQLKSANTLTTLNTRDVPIYRAGNDIMVDGARIIGQGIDAGNVVIYPVNAVMIPPMLT